MFYFRKSDVPIVHGHITFIDSPWALTGISQQQFWNNYKVHNYGDGTAVGILSLCISDWNTPGLNGKTAAQCSSTDEIAREVWAQVKLSLPKLPAFEQLHGYYLDQDIIIQPHEPTTNKEPLFTCTVNSWENRPFTSIEIPNLKLASDYVRGYTIVPTMELANESARRAVNSILVDLFRSDLCSLYPFYELALFKTIQIVDKWRFEHKMDVHRGLLIPMDFATTPSVNITCKVSYANEMRKFTLEMFEEKMFFTHMKVCIAELFRLSSEQESCLVIKYVDNEGDYITIAGYWDIKEAIKSISNHILRLTITLAMQPVVYDESVGRCIELHKNQL